MELEALMQESITNLEKDFYNSKFYFSYSSLSKLLWNPTVFHQIYILGLREEKEESHLVQGSVIHCLLLEEDKFYDKFLISPDNLPTGNLRTVVDRVFNHHLELKRNGDLREDLEDFKDAIIDVMQDMNYHQSLKTDEQRIDKVVTQESKNYWKFLQQKKGKTLIDQATYDFCKSAVEIIKTNQSVCKLIGCNTTEFDNVELFNEMKLQVDLPGKTFGLKGIVDNLVIDHDKKTIFINDIKTTSKDLKDFPESIEYYSYWLQAILYLILTSYYFTDLIENKKYEVKFHFVVIDRAFQTYAFPVSEATMKAWLERFTKTLQIAEWHYTNKNYELPYDFAIGGVVL